jgi:Carboxypeptidase regulatory-like domain/TonB dependent receptor-like, beta-barrel
MRNGAKRNSQALLSLLLSGTLICAIAISAHGQAVTGSVVGTITDTSGAVIPGATVTITDVGTNIARTITTDANGYYSFAIVKPATYKVTASKTGFATGVHSDVILSVNSTVRVDMTLKPGSVTQTINVTSEAPLLQTDSAQTGTTVTSTEVEQLPLSANRNFQNLMVMVPGVTDASYNHSRFFNVQTTLAVPVNGTNSLLSNVQIEGISDNERTGLLQVYVPPAESIQEVNTSTSNYDAEQGQALGAQVNVILKSGSNQFHGAAYEYWKGSRLVARSFFQVGPQGAPYIKPPFVFNQFGGNFGGPIRKGKTYFFFDYQRISDHEGQFQSWSVPTAAMRQGDFSDPALTNIYNPNTGNPDGTGRTQFPNNTINVPLDPIAQKLIALVPLPNNNLNAAGTQKYVNNYLTTTKFNQVLPSIDVKIDQYQGARDHISGWLSHMWPVTYQAPAYGAAGGPIPSGFEGSGTDSTWLGGITWSHVFSPTFLTETRIGLTRYRNEAQQQDYGTKASEAIGIPGVNLSAWTSGLTQITGEGFSDPMLGACTCLPWIRSETNFTYVSNWTKIKGNHTLKWGGSAFRIRDDLLSTNVYGLRGQWSFDTGPTALNGGPATGFANQFASFMLGIPSQVGRDLALVFPAYRAWQYALYLNDKWQVSPKLTANIGMRWEAYPGATPQFPGGFSQYDPNTNSLIIAGVGGNPMNLGMQARLHDFAPRIGVAYRVSDNQVLRAGFGISYGPFADNSYAYNYPVTQTNVFTNGGNSYGPALLPGGSPATFAAGLPAPIAAPIPSNGIIPADTPLLIASSYKVVNTHYLDPYIEAWNLTYERVLPGQWIFDLGYVGNHGVHVPIHYDLNAGFITGAGKLGQPLYNLYGRTASTTMYFATTTSSYNSLQAMLKHRFAAGYTVGIAYTYAKGLGIGGNCGENSCGPTYYVDFNRNWARLDFDRTHVFVANYTWDLPFGPKHRLFATGVPSAIMRGWQLSGLLTLKSGLPINMGCSCPLNTPGNGDSPNFVGSWKVLHGVGSQTWFDTSAFAEPASNTFGNVGIYNWSGPTLFNLDASLLRQIRLTERFGLEFRTDWFSATNTPQFSNPGGTFGSSSFGKVTSTLQTGSAIQQAYGGNRIIDFAMKLTF